MTIGSLDNDHDWNLVRQAFSEGSPVLVLGPGCSRIGYDTGERWKEVTRRARALHALCDEEHQQFLERLWLSKLSDETREAHAGTRLPSALRLDEKGAGKDDDPAMTKARVQGLAKPLLDALVATTQVLGDVIASGTTPVVSWHLVSHEPRSAPDDRREAAARRLSEASTNAGSLWHWRRGDALDAEDKTRLTGFGIDKPDLLAPIDTTDRGRKRSQQLDTLHIGAIFTSTRLLANQCVAVESPPGAATRLPLTGAMIEWLADLLWHLLIADSGVPPSQTELAFSVNLVQDEEPTKRSYSRAAPGEHRDTRQADLQEAIEHRIVHGVTGLEKGTLPDDTRQRFARTMAATLLVQWQRHSEKKGRLPVVLNAQYDLVLERHILNGLEAHEQFHMLVPVLVGPALSWMWGTYTKGEGTFSPAKFRSHRDNGYLTWRPYAGESNKEQAPPAGPVVIKVNGCPFLDLGEQPTLSSLVGAGPDGSSDGTKRYPDDDDDPPVRLLTVFSEYDSLRSMLAFRGVDAKPSSLASKIAIELDWQHRSWLFLGDRFPDWLPRLRLLLNIDPKVLLGAAEHPGVRGGKGPYREKAHKIAVDRHFDWPERALIEALRMCGFVGNLADLVNYPNQAGAFFADVRDQLDRI